MIPASAEPERHEEKGADVEDNYGVPISLIAPNYTDATKLTVEELEQLTNRAPIRSKVEGTAEGLGPYHFPRRLPFVPTKNLGDPPVAIPKTRKEFNDADRKAVEKNFRAKKILVCGIGPDEYNKILACQSDKEIWEALQTAHEGTTQVKQFKIDMLTTEYELFRMQDDESVQEMHTRFTSIINELHSLAETIPRNKLVKKILSMLPSSWQSKVNAITEAKDFQELTIDELDQYKNNSDKAAKRNPVPNRRFNRKNAADNVVKQALAAWGDSSRKSGEDDETGNSSMMAVESESTKETDRGLGFKGKRFLTTLIASTLLYLTIGFATTAVTMGTLKKTVRSDGTLKGSSQQWYMDSGYSRHITGSTNDFLSLKSLQGGNVSFGNGKKGYILGVGRIGKSLSHSIENVYYVNGLKTKDETFEVFVAFVKKIQVKMGNKVACIRSNHGTEFDNVKFDEFCTGNGITHNGVVERKNSTLEDMARTMLIDSGITSISGQKLSILRATWCKCFVHNNGKESLGKFDAKSDEGIFLEYSSQSKTYKDRHVDQDGEPLSVPGEVIDMVNGKADMMSHVKESSEEDANTSPSIGEEPGPPIITTEAENRVVDEVQGTPLCEVRSNQEYQSDMPGSSTNETQAPNWRFKKPKNIKEALKDVDSITAMQEELHQFEKNKPPGFECNEHPDHVFKLDKALYGLKQAPKVWYERLSKFLLEYGFARGKIDNTLFLKKRGRNLLIVQVYIDDIIFGATPDSLCEEFAKLIGSELEISMIGELNFFLGLQVKQSKKGTLISQQKHIKELLKRFDMEALKVIDTPSAKGTRLDMDKPGSPVNQTMYRGIIGSLLYLTASRSYIVFSVGLYARKIMSGMAHFLGSCLISWGTRKQNSVALSTAEAEYVDTLDDYRANKHLRLYTLVKRAKLTDKRSVREPGSPDTS
ncbi:PREDICTED: uncharacterized protein LOC109217857 [Nicotiana attenuata]|uniref:uncharacterized protein LOC109217857 n=1 Tax=Nicotiana attenuata TaxID=49451 RepID=UPI00090554F3|nr:PREDICTED: uncharacterized protein LOC109217857 [Nicotiana attenuata]